jgi:SAM-dependent methyltransferase
MIEDGRPSDGTRYDSIGLGYSQCRREDPVLYEKIIAALGSSQTVVNVGAGAGSYEPRDRTVLAVEPSEVMARQRSWDKLPAIKATADRLPFHDKSVDACMTVLSLHHWNPNQMAGVHEMRRIARDRIVIVTIDPRISAQMWLMADYLPEVADLDNRIFPLPETIGDWLGPATEIEVIPTSRDTVDWSLVSFWAHPERVLNPAARGATSAFARQSRTVVDRVVSHVARDLNSGLWDEKHGYLRGLSEYDAGMRMITTRLRPPRSQSR